MNTHQQPGDGKRTGDVPSSHWGHFWILGPQIHAPCNFQAIWRPVPNMIAMSRFLCHTCVSMLFSKKLVCIRRPRFCIFILVCVLSNVPSWCTHVCVQRPHFVCNIHLSGLCFVSIKQVCVLAVHYAPAIGTFDNLVKQLGKTASFFQTFTSI